MPMPDAENDFSRADAPDGDRAGSQTAETELSKELEDARDRVLRAQAELDNYRKRARREIEDAGRFANLPLMRDLLPVLDNISRAVKAADAAHDLASLLEGVKMVEGQLETVLRQNHCKKIDALGLPFDPHLHQAISAQPAKGSEPNTVIQVVQDGYQVHDRVVRPAQVIVSTSV